MLYSPSSGSAVTVLYFVILAQLNFLAGTVDAGYSPGGQCVDDGNCCFGQVNVDYSELVKHGPFKLLEIPQSQLSSRVDHIDYLIAESCDGKYSVDTQIFIKGSTTPLHNESVQKYLGRGFIDERGADDKGNSILFRIRILYLHYNFCMLYYRCQEGTPEAEGDTLYICCPANAQLTEDERQLFRKKASDCGFHVTWQRIE